MKIFNAFLFWAMLASSMHAQEISQTLKNHNSKVGNLVIFAFGMDNPVKIGTVDAKGKFSVNPEEIQIPDLTEEEKDMYFTELRNVFKFACGGRDDFGQEGNIPAIKGGNIALWAGNEWAGSFFLVSDPVLKPWLEDEGYNSAIKATFWDIIYVEEDAKLEMNCTNEIGMENGNIEVGYIFDLNLKKGFNWVEYSIEEVYMTNPEERASFPSKVRISNISDPERMQWMVNYFF